jgi:hypothetical protein
MNFIGLVQRLRQECGVSGAAPTTVANQPAEINRLVSWINTAWNDIQNAHADWFFLRNPVQFNTVAQQQSYTPAQAGFINLGNWKRDSFRLYSAAFGASNEMILPFKPYDDFRNLYMYGAMRTTYQRPVFFSIDPQRNFLLGGIPDDVYVINGEAYTKPTDLVNDADIPALPDRFHLLIVYRAMMHYGQFEAAPEVYQHGEIEFKKMMLRLELDQLPNMSFGAPLA